MFDEIYALAAAGKYHGPDQIFKDLKAVLAKMGIALKEAEEIIWEAACDTGGYPSYVPLICGTEQYADDYLKDSFSPTWEN